MTILIFHDDRLPEAVIEPMNGLSAGDLKGCREGMGVSVNTINGIEYLMTDGYCPRHDDWEEVSVLWLVRNDLNSWVWSQGKKVSKEQPIGTVIVLDISKEHGLNCKNGAKSSPAVSSSARRACWSKIISPARTSSGCSKTWLRCPTRP